MRPLLLAAIAALTLACSRGGGPSCDELVDHRIALAARDLPPDLRASVEATAADHRPEMMARCKTVAPSRDQARCMREADSLTRYDRCTRER